MKLPAHVSNAVKRLNPEVFEAGAPRLPANDSKPVKGDALVGARKGKAKGSVGSPRRIRIRFRIFAVRPVDYDGWSIKEVQDCLVHAGMLDGDDWDILQGEIISEKAHSQEEERTEIEVIWP